MKQTPAHEIHNPDLLRAIPENAEKIIEIGCSSGALAKAFKNLHPKVNWIGVEIEKEYAQMSARYCDKVFISDIDQCPLEFFNQFCDRDCWIFGDTLEHFKDPWLVLKKIRSVIPANGAVVACVPNAQHWSIVTRLAIGHFRYEESGLLDKTHLRWFTSQTLRELFSSQGYQIVSMTPRIFNEVNQHKFLPFIAEMAKVCGLPPEEVVANSIPIQYVLKAIPINTKNERTKLL